MEGPEIKVGMIDLREALGGGEDRTTMAEHYGVKEEEFEQNIKDMLCSLIQKEHYNETIDEFFPNLSAEDRLKVYSFAVAFKQFRAYMKVLSKGE